MRNIKFDSDFRKKSTSKNRTVWNRVNTLEDRKNHDQKFIILFVNYVSYDDP